MEAAPITQKSSDRMSKINNIQPTNRDITVRARVIIKSDIHPFSNNAGNSTMFTMNLLDDSGEVQLTAFGQCVNQFFDSVEVDMVYDFSKFIIQLSKSCVVNKFSIICTHNTTIIPCDFALDIPRLTFDNFMVIGEVEFMNKDEVIDILAICEDYGDIQCVNLKNGYPGTKRDLWLVDQSNKKIILTIWGSNADKFSKKKMTQPVVIAVRRARVSNYSKKSLDCSCLSSSTIQVDPDMTQADELKIWYSTARKTAEIKLLSNRQHPTMEFVSMARAILQSKTQ